VFVFSGDPGGGEMRIGYKDIGGDKVQEAIDSIQSDDMGEYKPYCPTCGYYIYKEKVWKFVWPSDYYDTKFRCMNCFPTKESLANGIRNGRAFRRAAMQS
jgi:hypothetical protein